MQNIQTVKLNIPAELYQSLQKQAKEEKKSITEVLQSFWYFYKEETNWQKMEAEADEDIRTGRIKEFSNLDDLIKDLNS